MRPRSEAEWDSMGRLLVDAAFYAVQRVVSGSFIPWSMYSNGIIVSTLLLVISEVRRLLDEKQLIYCR